ncbi:MAG: hypothetical protein GX895_04540 [Clostridiales bacterium]|uniref:hypothetical protein n=1 Tax=Clostridium sp. N3C TaxID=1776758 RepID=UPI00092DF685|nr:hypothetical protein [Clostridium sp. N3C]NLZ48048.1 hypothetical protein [Clostridiales bacterium]SCN22221.1 hypothetical protein N3C_0651 [Clostridium sp. N3C]
MSLRFSREYKRIIEEIADGLLEIEDIYNFLGMEKDIWQELHKEDRIEFSKTLADDIFYALGKEPIMEIGNDRVEYSREKSEIYIVSEENIIKTVKL